MSYYNLDAILAENAYVPGQTSIDMLQLGFLDDQHAADEDVSQCSNETSIAINYLSVACIQLCADINSHYYLSLC
jgi:hypothetical protein